MKQKSFQSSVTPLIFTRRDPQKYVVLYARLGADGAEPRTEYFKPTGTDYAGPDEIAELGYVPDMWRKLAFFAIHCLSLVASEQEFDEKFIPALRSRFGDDITDGEFWDMLNAEAHRLDGVPPEARGVAVVRVEDQE